MSIRRRGAEPVVAAPRLTAVLATRQREVVATRGLPFFRKGVEAKFRKAAEERDGAKADKAVADAARALERAQADTLAREYARIEERAWGAMDEAAKKADHHAVRHGRVEALKSVLEAQLGLFALHAHGPDGAVPAPPKRPDMPEISKSRIWPSFEIKRGSTPWPNYRMIHDCWLKANELSASTSLRE
jgi:hypothetical protein